MFKNVVRYNWAVWFMGIMRSVIQGGANGVLSGIVAMGVDPVRFNLVGGLGHTLEIMGGMFILSSIIAMCTFLATHGTPDVESTIDVK